MRKGTDAILLAVAGLGLLWYFAKPRGLDFYGEDGLNWTQRALLPAYSLSVSEEGRALLIEHEGYRREPYKDSAGKWTVGIGHLIRAGDGLLPNEAWSPDPNGSGMIVNATGEAALRAMVLTDGQIQILFVNDLARVETFLRSAIKAPLTQHMFDACADLAFNIGTGAFGGSTLLRHLNTGDYIMAGDQFPKWIYAGGRVDSGLIARRGDNERLFLT